MLRTDFQPSGRIRELLAIKDPGRLGDKIGAAPELRDPALRWCDVLQLQAAYPLLEYAESGVVQEEITEPRLLGAAKTILGIAGQAVSIQNLEVGDPLADLTSFRLPSAVCHRAIVANKLNAGMLSEVLATVPCQRARLAHEAHAKDIAALLPDENEMRQLHEVVPQAVGLRFDQFLTIHQFGPQGFYSTRLDLSSSLGQMAVATPIHCDEQYRAQIVRNVCSFINNYFGECVAQGRDFRKSPFVFAEIGGGNGDFKRAFVDLVDEEVAKGLMVPVEYVSIDLNKFQLLNQAVPGTRLKFGSAISTGLASESVDFLFNEEVPDCFVHRWLRWEPGSKKLESEAYVVRNDGRLEIEFRPIERSAEVDEVEAHLRKIDYKVVDYMFSNQDRQYWAEARRVIRPGGYNCFIDYTMKGLLAGRASLLASINMAINSPYNDITRGIDPYWMLRVAEQEKFSCKAGYIKARQSHPSEERIFFSARRDR